MHEHHDHNNPCSGHGHCHSCGEQNSMSFEEKISLLLTHWIEHNDSHEEDYKKWASQAKKEGMDEVVELILAALNQFKEGNNRLRQAKQILDMG
ncbi:MAG: zinc transporter [Deltaproteobacteria bacterium]|nr:zinc transporter [Candidatus Anaeroferrophillus wilburensis]MBN2888433.1 zinc transporter [Deltaproteobacteria bacterium]